MNLKDVTWNYLQNTADNWEIYWSTNEWMYTIQSSFAPFLRFFGNRCWIECKIWNNGIDKILNEYTREYERKSILRSIESHPIIVKSIKAFFIILALRYCQHHFVIKTSCLKMNAHCECKRVCTAWVFPNCFQFSVPNCKQISHRQ